MIFDSIKNASLYANASGRLWAALEYLARTDFSNIQAGKHVIQGDELFAMVQRYDSRPIEQGKWEAHRRYIDVQFLAAGSERMGIASLDSMAIKTPYDDQKDLVILSGQGELLTMQAGQFMVLYPHEAHMPCIAVDAPQAVTKVVVKVAV